MGKTAKLEDEPADGATQHGFASDAAGRFLAVHCAKIAVGRLPVGRSLEYNVLSTTS